MKKRSDMPSRPIERDPLYKTAILYAVSLALIIAVAVWVAYAQPPDPGFGDTVEMGRTLGGSTLQSASTPGKVLVRAVNYFGNVVCPLAAAIFVILTIVAYYTGRGAGRYAIVTVMLLLVAGLTRLMENFVIRAGP